MFFLVWELHLSLFGSCFALCPEHPFCAFCFWGWSFRDAKPFFLQMTKKGVRNPISVDGVPTVRAHSANPEQQLACALEHGPTLPSSFHESFVHFCFLASCIRVLTQLYRASAGESRSCIDFCLETQNRLKWSQHEMRDGRRQQETVEEIWNGNASKKPHRLCLQIGKWNPSVQTLVRYLAAEQGRKTNSRSVQYF